MKKTVFLSLLFWFLANALMAQDNTPDSTEPRAGDPVVQVRLGESVVALTGPWKFHIGDSPIDPATHRPLWADPDFDDSGWETVDMTPETGSIDPTSGWTGYVRGWTARGHSGYWGYGWYRIRVQEQEFRGEEQKKLALWDVDDVYQFFGDGKLIGVFGEFRPGKPPVTYWTLPEIYDLPEPRVNDGRNIISVTHVLAFRLWCGANTLTQNPDGCGLHIAPVMGNAAAVRAEYQRAWLEIIESYGAIAAEALYGFSNALGEDLFYTLTPHGVSAAFHLVAIGIRLSFLGLLVLIVVHGIRQQGREGWLALPAVVLVGIAQFQIDLVVLHVPTIWYPLGVGIGLSDIASAALSVVIFALLLRRLQQSLKRQRQMALDVKQAQEVQQVILPQALSSFPGLEIASEYRPAREVGGDFFQIIPDETDGSVLIVVGDVTGKGLKAGMLVALLVGAIRSTVEMTTEPIEMLQALNRRLLGRGDAQATCLVLRIEKDGSATLANAGHIAPYLNGEPMAMEGALPLGMMEGAEFSVMHFKLNERDRLMLMSDGIAEATDANGKLFGFERVHDLLRASRSASDVATAAQKFGQEDDISVISVTCTAKLTSALV